MSLPGGTGAPSHWLDRLAYWHGRVADSSAVWFPFIFLRPAPNELIRPARRLAMTLCFGSYASLSWPLWQWLLGDPFTARAWGIFLVKCLAGFAIWFRLVTIPLWNRRAKFR